MTDYTNETLNYVGIIMSAILPVAVVWYFKNTERRRTEKELKAAEELKRHTERTAQDLKLASVDIAIDLRKHLDEKISNIDKPIEDLAGKVTLIHDNQSEITRRVDGMATKQMETHRDQLELISDLRQRADLTNGNIRNIRNDIMDVQESLEDLSDNPEKVTMISQTNKNRERRTKRRQIADESEAQGNAKHTTGSR